MTAKRFLLDFVNKPVDEPKREVQFGFQISHDLLCFSSSTAAEQSGWSFFSLYHETMKWKTASGNKVVLEILKSQHQHDHTINWLSNDLQHTLCALPGFGLRHACIKHHSARWLVSFWPPKKDAISFHNKVWVFFFLMSASAAKCEAIHRFSMENTKVSRDAISLKQVLQRYCTWKHCDLCLISP